MKDVLPRRPTQKSNAINELYCLTTGSQLYLTKCDGWVLTPFRLGPAICIYGIR
ncbi:hypothetical protein [Marinobacter sp.]|uniref:hypothetical protein n=1 Tax=Marinobacter sp. TaxID=50741 RepID=UPI003983111E